MSRVGSNEMKKRHSHRLAENRTMGRKSYDSKCYDLAEHFLPNDAPKSTLNRLAIAIQDAVEDWFAAEDASVEDEAPEREPDSDRTLGLTC
jgi:hypothetical protein